MMYTNNRKSYWLQSLQTNHGQHDREINTEVVGVNFNGRQAVVGKLRVGEEVLLRREPTNPYDPNAIKVERRDGEQFGYLNRYLAADLAAIFDLHREPVPAIVTHISDGPSRLYNRDVQIRFIIPE